MQRNRKNPYSFACALILLYELGGKLTGPNGRSWHNNIRALLTDAKAIGKLRLDTNMQEPLTGKELNELLKEVYEKLTRRGKTTWFDGLGILFAITSN